MSKKPCRLYRLVICLTGLMPFPAAAQAPACIPEELCLQREDFIVDVQRRVACGKLGITKTSFSGYQIATATKSEMPLTHLTTVFPQEDLPDRFKQGATTVTFPNLKLARNVIVDFTFEAEMEWARSNTTTLSQIQGLRTVYGSDPRPVKTSFTHNGVYRVTGMLIKKLACHYIAIERVE